MSIPFGEFSHGQKQLSVLSCWMNDHFQRGGIIDYHTAIRPISLGNTVVVAFTEDYILWTIHIEW